TNQHRRDLLAVLDPSVSRGVNDVCVCGGCKGGFRILAVSAGLQGLSHFVDPLRKSSGIVRVGVDR
ncbi:hypothetical protein CpipJ_CPIJ007539, partial [Culex quinquefasciatus]